MGIKYEQLPNFCYWCGRINHYERECKIRLRGKGQLKREEQQYGEWLRANPVRITRKLWLLFQGHYITKHPSGNSKNPHVPSQNFFDGASTKTRPEGGLGSATGKDENWDDSEASNYASPLAIKNLGIGEPIFCDENQGMGRGVTKQHSCCPTSTEESFQGYHKSG